jgi:hypothetical protein
MADAEVQAAMVTAAAALGAAVASFSSNLFLERRQRAANLIVAALSNFGGRSQLRSVGIASLQVLSGKSKAWKDYRDTVRQLYYAQLLYLFVHGRNRWESHEIANMEAMMEWLVSRGKLAPTKWDSSAAKRLTDAMDTYVKDYDTLLEDDRREDEQRQKKRREEEQGEDDSRPDEPSIKHRSEHGGRPDEASIEHIRSRISAWQQSLRRSSA